MMNPNIPWRPSGAFQYSHQRAHAPFLRALAVVAVFLSTLSAAWGQQRRPIDHQHPLWLVHVDVWNKADPQKIIDLIPDDVKPYVCMNLSLSCQYDVERGVYKMPQNAIRTYKSWASVCQHNGLWFTCQPASGGHTHIQDDDLETFEYFFRRYPNFLGWNYAEQFWGFDEAGDKSSSSQASRIALFAKLVEMSHRYGGFLTVSFCGNIWSHALNPLGMMKRNADLLEACRQYPEAILWLYKYTTSSCFYNNESVTWGPFVSGLATNYGVRYDNCGWNGALDALLGKGHGKEYPTAAGLGTVMEQTAVNGGAVWDGPELIWTEDFQNLENTTVNGYTRRNWGTFAGFRGGWLDMFRKVIDGTLYIPSRREVVEKTKVVVINDITSGTDEQCYAAWGSLYDGLYKQTDPFNRGDGQWMNNFCYFKRTGRYGAVPVVTGLYDDAARAIPVQVNKSAYTSRWGTQAKKVADFDAQYAAVSEGDLYVNRYRNQLVTYTPYTYLNRLTTASARIPLEYNTCQELRLVYGKLSSGLVREWADRIDIYLNNYRTDTVANQLDQVIIAGASSEPTYTVGQHEGAAANVTSEWDAATGTFTLSVRHLGAVDLHIRCSGSADRSAAPAALPADTLPLPAQPAPFEGPLIVEAEDMDYKSVRSCVTDPYTWYPSVSGHAGNGFMDMGTSTEGTLRHQPLMRAAGEYRIAIRYTNTNKAGSLLTRVNGARKSVSCPVTARNEWRKATFTATLKEGQNDVLITNQAGIDMYIDQIIYTPAGEPDEQFLVTIRPAENGTAVASAAEAAEGDEVTLTAVPDEGYAFGGWTIVHGDVTIADDGTFTMPDDNVTLQPVFIDVAALYSLDFTDVLSGNMPEGWRAVDGNDVHQYPNSYGSGARTFSGFTGYQGKALYWRNTSAEYGRLAGCPLALEPGDYRLHFAMAAWKAEPQYRARIVSSANKVLASSPVYTAAPNANGTASANLTAAEEHTLEFSVAERGNYIINFSNAGSGFDEFLLLSCRLRSVSSTGISQPSLARQLPRGIYSPSGLRRQQLQKGLNIVVTADGRALKVMR